MSEYPQATVYEQEQPEIAELTSIEAESQGLLSRISERAGEIAREYMPRRLTVALAGAAIAVGGTTAVEYGTNDTTPAEAATPMVTHLAERPSDNANPQSIEKSIQWAMTGTSERHAFRKIPKVMNINKASITRGGNQGLLKGENKGVGSYLYMKDNTKSDVVSLKQASYRVRKYSDNPDYSYSPTLSALEPKVISSTKQNPNRFGELRAVKVVKKGKLWTKAVAKFDKPTSFNSGRAVRSVTLDAKGKLVDESLYK